MREPQWATRGTHEWDFLSHIQVDHGGRRFTCRICLENDAFKDATLNRHSYMNKERWEVELGRFICNHTYCNGREDPD